MKVMQNDPDMLEEYDFSRGIRGKYAKRYTEGTNVVVIDPDVAPYFPDHDSVNSALRSLLPILKRHINKNIEQLPDKCTLWNRLCQMKNSNNG